MKGWSIPALLREAALNVATPGRGIWLIVATLLAASTIAGYGASTHANFERDLDAQVLQGRNTVDFTGGAQGEQSIERRSCDSMAEQPGVEVAGAIVEAGRFAFPQIGNSVRVVWVSRTLVPELNDHDAIVGSALDLAASDFILLSEPFGALDATTGSPYEAPLGLSSAVVLPLEADVEWVETCTAQLERYSEARTAGPVLASSLNATTTDVLSTERLAAPFDLVQQYQNRLDRYGFAAVGFVGGLVFALRYRLRSSEIAAYRFAGTSRADLLRLVLTEQFILAGLFTTSGCITTWLLTQGSATAALSAWAISGGAAWWAAAALANAPLVFANPVGLAKDR